MGTSRSCGEGGLCEAAVLLKRMTLELQLNFMPNQVITCLSSLLLVCPHQELQKLNQQETTLPPSKRGEGRKRERIVFCWFSSLKWLIRRAEESQRTHNGGSGAVGPEDRNEGSKGLLLRRPSLGKTFGELQSEQHLSLEVMGVKCLQLPAAGLLAPLVCPCSA